MRVISEVNLAGVEKIEGADVKCLVQTTAPIQLVRESSNQNRGQPKASSHTVNLTYFTISVSPTLSQAPPQPVTKGT